MEILILHVKIITGLNWTRTSAMFPTQRRPKGQPEDAGVTFTRGVGGRRGDGALVFSALQQRAVGGSIPAVALISTQLSEAALALIVITRPASRLPASHLCNLQSGVELQGCLTQEAEITLTSAFSSPPGLWPLLARLLDLPTTS